MSRIGDFFKTPHTYNDFFNNKMENDETAKIRSEINKLNKLIEQKSDELFTIYGEMYGGAARSDGAGLSGAFGGQWLHRRQPFVYPGTVSGAGDPCTAGELRLQPRSQ